METEETKPKRPAGIKWAGYFYKWVGLFYSITAFCTLLYPSALIDERLRARGQSVYFQIISLVLLLIMGLALYIAAVGLLNLRSWGRKGMIVMSVVVTLIFSSGFSHSPSIHEKIILSFCLMLSIGLFFYLYHPRIKELFVNPGIKGMRWL